MSIDLPQVRLQANTFKWAKSLKALKTPCRTGWDYVGEFLGRTPLVHVGDLLHIQRRNLEVALLLPLFDNEVYEIEKCTVAHWGQVLQASARAWLGMSPQQRLSTAYAELLSRAERVLGTSRDPEIRAVCRERIEQLQIRLQELIDPTAQGQDAEIFQHFEAWLGEEAARLRVSPMDITQALNRELLRGRELPAHADPTSRVVAARRILRL